MAKNAYGDVCANLRCTYSRLKPIGTWYDTLEECWVCFPCAQARNRDGIRYGFTKPQCIDHKKHLFSLLTQ